jgi:hypothetical protein
MNLSGLGYVQVEGSCECDNKSSGSIKRLVAHLVASRVVLSSIELVSQLVS